MSDEIEDGEESPPTDITDGGEKVLYAGQKIIVNYCKSPQYRTIHVDGAFGGVTPMGRTISIAFFSERNSLPDTVYVPIMADEDGSPRISMGNDRDRDNARPGIMREVEANIILDLEAAEQLKEWLAVRVEKLKKAAEGSRVLQLDPKGVVNRPWQ